MKLVSQFVSKASEILGGARAEVARVQEVTQDLDDRIAAVQSRLNHASADHGSLKNMGLGIEEVVATEGEAGLRELAPELLAIGGSVQPRGDGGVEFFGPAIPYQLAGPITFRMLCVLMPTVVVTGLRAAVGRINYTPGADLSTRAATIASAKAELDGLLEEHAALVDEASAVGITIPHLPENTARRHEAERRAEREARDHADKGLTQRLRGRL